MATPPTTNEGLPLDSRGRPQNPLDPARGIVLGQVLGMALWAVGVALLHALL